MDEKVEEIIKQVMGEVEVDKETLIDEIEEKQKELSGFITPEGAATIVARGYGVVPEREEPEVRKLRIDDLSLGMSNVDIVGRIVRIFEPHEFDRRDGSKGRVANLVLMDNTGQIRTVLWDEMADLVTQDEIQKGTVVRLEGAYIKKGFRDDPELNMGRRGKVELDPEDERAEDLPPVSDIKVNISDLQSDQDFVDVVGRITAVTAPRTFERSNGSEGKVSSLRIVDGTGQTRVSLWGDRADQTEEINQGDAVRLENASVREGRQGSPELHLSWRGRVVLNPPQEEVRNLPEFERKLLKIEEIEPDMPALDIAARVRRTFPVREFDRKDDSKGRVMNVILADETGTIRASFWDDTVEKSKKLSAGDSILLENARSSVGLRDKPEVRVGQRTNVRINPRDVEIKDVKPSRFKLAELEEGLDSLEVVGRVVDFSEVRKFTRSNGSEGKVASLTIGDCTGRANVTLWGPKTEVLDELEEGSVIRIMDAYTVPGDFGSPEVHIGREASLEIDPSVKEELPSVEDIGTESVEEERVSIEDAEENKQIQIRGTVVRLFQRPPLFDVCPKCGRALGSGGSETFCDNCGEDVDPDHRIVLNMIVDDGTANIRVVVFGELGERLIGKTAEEISKYLSGDMDLENLYDEIDLTGKEIVLSGSVRRDDYYDQLELRAREFSFPDPRKEAERILGIIKA